MKCRSDHAKKAARSMLGAFLAAFGLAACASPGARSSVSSDYFIRGGATYEKYLPRAQAGDAKYQNLLGYMTFFGEGAAEDLEQSHLWFHLAARQSFEPAQHNLQIIHRLGLAYPLDHSEAEIRAHAHGSSERRRVDQPAMGIAVDQAAQPGATTYATFCAGCHGLNGIAAYSGSPSFALGERMRKSDAELLDSIRNGRGVMPAWEGKLEDSDLFAVLDFVRDLERRYLAGIDQALFAAPDVFFLFGPMIEDDSAYYRHR